MNLYLDFETYSPVKISHGLDVYMRQAEIILSQWALDSEDVIVHDHMAEPGIPETLEAALLDQNVTIVAHNATFERNALKHCWGLDLPPERFFCTMACAAAHSLPLSLNALGKVMRCTPKIYGKDHIFLFCVPPARNSKRGRATPQTHPDEWLAFKEYAKRDVVTCREIFHKIPKANYKGKHFALWCLDQRINDEGVQVDTALAEGAVSILADEKKHTDAKVQALTNGEVTAATQRDRLLLVLLRDHGVLLDNMRADELQRKLEDERLPAPVRELIKTRISAAMASTAKFTRLLGSVGPDGRLRNTLQYCGATRTGRWCLEGDHEVLTKSGWVPIQQWKGGDIAQYHTSGTIKFLPADRVAFKYEGEMLCARRKNRINSSMTPEHVLLTNQGPRSAGYMYGRIQQGIPRGGEWIAEWTSTIRTRVLVMLQHDGHVRKDYGAVTWLFTKKRKFTRCQKLLGAAHIKFKTSTSTPPSSGKTHYHVYVPALEKPTWLVKKDFGPWLLEECHNPYVFIMESHHWDGGGRRDKQLEVCSKDKINADWTVTMAHLAGFAGTVSQRKNGYWYACVTMSRNKMTLRPETWNKKEFKGNVYCASTKTGYFLVRRKGSIFVTGNSGRNMQLQNLKRPTETPGFIADCIGLIKEGDRDTLSLLTDPKEACANSLRGLLVAAPGHKLVVSDWSNIEARVVAWLAGEQWVLDAVHAADNGEAPDIYVQTICQALGLDPQTFDKTTAEGKLLRQQGKTVVLACGYGGGAGAFASMAAVTGLDLDELKRNVETIPAWAVEEAREAFPWFKVHGLTHDMDEDTFAVCDALKRVYRKANPRIQQFWWDCENAFRTCCREPHATMDVGPVQFQRRGGWLRVRLPGGRYLMYPSPKIKHVNDPACEAADEESLSYMGEVNKKWRRQHTFGGKICENATQSMACDLLKHTMLRLADGHWSPVLTVHDEIICEEPVDAGRGIQELNAVMQEPPEWAVGLPLAAEGYEDVRYHK